MLSISSKRSLAPHPLVRAVCERFAHFDGRVAIAGVVAANRRPRPPGCSRRSGRSSGVPVSVLEVFAAGTVAELVVVVEPA